MMLRKRNSARQRVGTSSPANVPAPVGGWNARDAVVNMPPTDAIELVNLFPETDRIRVRTGWAQHSTGMGSTSVESLFPYKAGTTTKLIAGGNGNVYDATASTASSLASGFTSNRWNGFQFQSNLLLVNGTDTPQTYNGSTVGTAGLSGSGLTATDLSQGTVFTQRMFFVEKNSGSAWYGGVAAVTGVLTEFDVGQFASGSNLEAIGVWSRDSGSGVDDYIAFWFQSGQVLVYQGTNPATDFALVGSFWTGPLINNRCLFRFGGELMALTRGGVVPLSFVMSGASLDQLDNHPLWGKIRGALTTAVANHADSFGWQGHLCVSGCSVFLNIPIIENTTTEQYVMNVINGAWCRFTSTAVQPQSWASYEGLNYAGGTDGKVYVHSGDDDIDSAIQCSVNQAFVRPREGASKVTAIRPIGGVDAEVNVSIGLDIDYVVDSLRQTVKFGEGIEGGTEWDTAQWDAVTWGSDAVAQTKWHALGREGHAFSLGMNFSAKDLQFDWNTTQYLLQPGGNV